MCAELNLILVGPWQSKLSVNSLEVYNKLNIFAMFGLHGDGSVLNHNYYLVMTDKCIIQFTLKVLRYCLFS